MALSALAFAAEKPNFSGLWKFNPERTDSGVLPKPKVKITVKVEHQEPVFNLLLTIWREDQEVRQEFKARTDGKIYHDTYGPQTCSLVWEGEGIRMKLFDGQGNLIGSNLVRLDPTGKTLIREGVGKSSAGEVKIREVWEKQ
ncbi:MAG TPA: hypothetical protein DEH78_10380 [Solibacterales bacterium]|nr:hypothetical protein [Bryobacterales bacterium]